VTTNGTMIAERADLLDHLDEVVVSLDSARPEAHDRLRGAGSHAKAVRAIERSRAAGRRTFVTAVITRVNLDQLEELVDWCEARELRVHCQPVIFGHQYFDEGARAVALSEEEQRAVHLRLAQWKKQGRRLLFTAEAYAQVAGWGDHDVLSTPWDGTSPSPCMAGKYHVHFEANGDVHPCVLHKATLVPKNAVRDGLEEALRHVQQHDCGDCFTACLVERKLVFGLRPAAVLEALRRD
jgi:MoaA/NifB/PqqE/SkfB family radical SAM enzyme